MMADKDVWKAEMREVISARLTAIREEILLNAVDLARDQYDANLHMHIRLVAEFKALEEALRLQPTEAHALAGSMSAKA